MVKRDPTTLPPAVILGLSSTSLGVVRSLGRRGIRVIGIDYQKDRIGSYSKYCIALSCPKQWRAEDRLLKFMEKLANQIGDNPVLIPTNDAFVLFLSRNRHRLSQYFKFMLASEEIIEKLNNKKLVNKIAEKHDVPAPETFSPKDMEEVNCISKKIKYPCVIKPAYGYLYNDLNFKAVLATNPCELIDIYEKLPKYLQNLVIQDYIPGRDDAQISFAAYFNAESEPLATFTSRKIRQNPPVFGTGTLVGVCHEPKIEQIGISFLKKIKYKGLAEIEFKKDLKKDCFKMIEVNTRIWTQNNLAARCGVDIAYIAYKDILGLPTEGNKQCDRGMKWINIYEDIIACFGSSGYFQRGEITFSQWINSVLYNNEHAVFAKDDVKPFIKSTKTFISRISNKIRNR